MGAQQAKETKTGKRERKSKDNRQIIQNFAQETNGRYCFQPDLIKTATQRAIYNVSRPPKSLDESSARVTDTTK